MSDTTNVRLGLEYLDKCLANGTEATLVGMHWAIDAQNKCIPEADEVNAVLAARPDVGVARDGSVVRFVKDGVQHHVSAADMAAAYSQYHAEFSALYEKTR